MSLEYEVWESEDGLMKMMCFDAYEFMEEVSTRTKNEAKKRGLLHLDTSGAEQMVVLTDPPEKYEALLRVYGIEEYLEKRVRGEI